MAVAQRHVVSASPGVYVSAVPTGMRSIAGVSTSIAAFVGVCPRGPLNEARRIVSVDDFEDIFGSANSGGVTAQAVSQFFDNGGTEAWVVRAAGKAGTNAAPPDADSVVMALGALDRIDLFNVLCVPDTMRLGVGQAAIVAAKATTCCEKRRVFYLFDVPNTQGGPAASVAAMQRWITTNSALRHPNVAVYFPRPMVGDLMRGGSPAPIAGSGSIAGLFARTDRQRGVWKAPAGLEARLQGVQALEVSLTDADNALLNTLGINCLRQFSGKEILCWGARTLVGADHLPSEWKYIPVRRTALFVEESLYRGTQWAAIEPNDARLWSSIRAAVNAFMMSLFQSGAFQGAKPEDAFYVRCDSTTTTPVDRNRGIVNVEVGFAPLRPAEFVVIRIRQKARTA